MVTSLTSQNLRKQKEVLGLQGYVECVGVYVLNDLVEYKEKLKKKTTLNKDRPGPLSGLFWLWLLQWFPYSHN